ncbi:MAG: hypothetical protein ACTSPO_15920 [Candidatus Heimdallarchaeaceae archaeon]
MLCDMCGKPCPNNEWNGYRSADGLTIRFCNTCNTKILKTNEDNCRKEKERKEKEVEAPKSGMEKIIEETTKDFKEEVEKSGADRSTESTEETQGTEA